MHRPSLPGRTSLFTAAALTALAAVGLLASPGARAAVSMQHMATYETGIWAASAAAQRQLAGRGERATARSLAYPKSKSPGHSRDRGLLRDSDRPAADYRIRTSP